MNMAAELPKAISSGSAALRVVAKGFFVGTRDLGGVTEMNKLNAVEANARIWTTYLANGWGTNEHRASSSITEAMAAMISASLAPWLALLTASTFPPSADASTPN